MSTGFTKLASGTPVWHTKFLTVQCAHLKLNMRKRKADQTEGHYKITHRLVSACRVRHDEETLRTDTFE